MGSSYDQKKANSGRYPNMLLVLHAVLHVFHNLFTKMYSRLLEFFR